MAVVLMDKFRLLAHKSDVRETLAIMQRFGAVQFHEVELPTLERVSTEFIYAETLPRLQHVVSFLETYTPKVSLYRILRDGTQTELSEKDIEQKTSDLDAVIMVVDDVEKVQVEFAEHTESVRTLEDLRTQLIRWRDLPIRLADLETKQTKTLLLFSPDGEASVVSDLTVALNNSQVDHHITVLDSKTVALTLAKEDVSNDQMLSILKQLQFTSEAIPSGEEDPAIELTKVEYALEAAKESVARMHDQAEHFAITHLKNLQIVAELLSWKRSASNVEELGVSSTSVVILEGWINQAKRSVVETALANANLAVTLETIEPGPDEEPPVEIVNNTFIQPFEVVTRLYGMPGHKDLDPTVFLAGFFFLFFGLSLTDVGYGLFLMIVSGLLLTVFKIPRTMRTFAKLLFLMGSASLLVGLLFAGYLGISPESLPHWLIAIQLFDPIGNPLPVFYMALALGVIQIMFGMVLKIYSEARNDRLVTGILDQGPWLAMFFILITYLAAATGYITAVTTDQLVYLIYLGIVMIVVSSGRTGDTVLEKLKNSALSLYASIGYFSDILSYSRLLALGLATTALAFAVNLIADIVRESVPYVGVIFAIVVLVIGHLFTLAVNTLGAFIHSARLQFVEFFGKFIDGTGKQFTPLIRTEKHVIAINDE